MATVSTQRVAVTQQVLTTRTTHHHCHHDYNTDTMSMQKETKGDTPVDVKAPKPDAKKNSEEEDLNEEDLKLKEELEMLVERLTEKDELLYPEALRTLTTLIRTSTSSMTAVPKPLKFLKPHYPTLVKIYDAWPQHSQLTKQLGGILSVLGMTQGTALKYRLLADDDEAELAAWGHEYLRHLALEIGDEFHRRQDIEDSNVPDTGDLLDLALKIVPFFLKHNAETDAVDLLLEVDSVERLADDGLMDAEMAPRVCEYLLACADYLDTDSRSAALHTAYGVYKQYNDMPQALLLAIRLDDEELVRSVFQDTTDSSLRKQLAFIVARQRRFYDLVDRETEDLPEDIADIVRNTKLSSYFHYLAKELNLTKAKTPHEVLRSPGDSGVFKSHGERSKTNLANIFVRGFLNAGYSNMSEDFSDYADAASSSSRARSLTVPAVHTSLGLGYMWDYVEALQQLDPYLDDKDELVRSGAVLGVGVATVGVHDETDAVMGLLADLVAEVPNNTSSQVHTSAILGLGFAYAGAARDEIAELLEPLVTDVSLPMEISALAAVALGIVFVGSASGVLTTSILEALIEREASDLAHPWAIFMGLGLGLLYLQKSDKIDAVVETVKAIDHPVAQNIEVLLVICAFAGTGDVLQIQRLLRETATRHYEDEDDEDEDDDLIADGPENAFVDAIKKVADAQRVDEEPETATEVSASDGPDVKNPEAEEVHSDAEMKDSDEKAGDDKEEEDPESRRESAKAKGLCTLGIGLISLGENIGEEMVMRHLEHLMHYGDSHIKQAVPLAMGLVSTSNPQMKVYETLSRYTHELQPSVANNAIFALGLVGAGTLNARVAQLLRQLDEFYARSSELMFMSRFALGLVNLGKGTLTLSPFTAEKRLMSPVSLAGLLTVSVAMLIPPAKQLFISEYPSLLYALTLAVQPRMLVTVDEELNPLKVTVRVGQAIDTVGQAGKPKRITGWVTQDTPVLLAAGERAELEDDEYTPLSTALEGVVILRKREE